jgi:hypothetical protein
MVSTAFSLDAAVKSIKEDGFVHLEDTPVGELVLEMEQQGINFLSMLDYCKNNILSDTVKFHQISLISPQLTAVSALNPFSSRSWAGVALDISCDTRLSLDISSASGRVAPMLVSVLS